MFLHLRVIYTQTCTYIALTGEEYSVIQAINAPVLTKGSHPQSRAHPKQSNSLNRFHLDTHCFLFCLFPFVAVSQTKERNVVFLIT